MSNRIIALCGAGMFAVGLTACSNGGPSAACARIAAQTGPLVAETHAASTMSELAKLKAEIERNIKEIQSCQTTGSP
jgi:hypothetical protein